MTKTDFVEKLSKELKISKKDASKFLDKSMDIIIETVSNGEEVTFTGFGKFYVSERSEKIGRNPKTGESITIPAKLLPRFKVGKVFKDAVAE